MTTVFSNLQNEGQQELIQHAIDGLKDRGTGKYACDVHQTLFNEDYYIIGSYKAEKWLSYNIGMLAAIEAIKEYEQSNFGEITTDLSEAEQVLNMLVYIAGDELLSESETLNKKWNEKLTDEDIEQIISELESI